MTWYTLSDGSQKWIAIEPFYCWCCKQRHDHCFCSRHVDPVSGLVCTGCMKHDTQMVDREEVLLNGDRLIRKVKEHVCRFD